MDEYMVNDHDQSWSFQLYSCNAGNKSTYEKLKLRLLDAAFVTEFQLNWKEIR